jgi:hypothetical protein
VHLPRPSRPYDSDVYLFHFLVIDPAALFLQDTALALLFQNLALQLSGPGRSAAPRLFTLRDQSSSALSFVFLDSRA